MAEHNDRNRPIDRVGVVQNRITIHPTSYLIIRNYVVYVQYTAVPFAWMFYKYNLIKI